MAIRLWCYALIVAVAAAFAPTVSRADQVSAAALDDRGLPLVLSKADAERYRQIFALQEAGQMGKADDLIFQLQDQRLLGHVLAQRYLHPTAWKSKYGELKSWLSAYNDLPEADDIYELALKKGGKKADLDKPYVSPASLSGPVEGSFQPYRSERDRSAAEAKKVSDIKGKIRGYLKDDNLGKALAVVQGKEAQRLLDTVELDQAYAQIAQAAYFDGDDLRALELASPAGERSGSYVPAANWIAGLAAWRQGSFDLAAQHFEAVALSDRVNGWLASGGAYWAARAHLRRRDPAEMSYWLSLAAEYPRTFYGQLAREALGLRTQFDFRSFRLTDAGVRLVAASPAGGRAMALLQVGQDELAEQELMLLEGWDSVDATEVLLAIADQAQLARFAFKLANRLADADGNNRSGKPLLAALYPVPPWEPPSGYFVDEALVYALIRQESAFDPGAKSHAGARGLMQIMPATASYISGDGSLKGGQKDNLYDTALNLQLGQEYLVHLMSLGEVGNDLFRLCAAYNGGPGNLQKWQRETNFAGDPLLFIESIPAGETRDYIERVLANYWIYSARLNKPTPSLSDIANGDWPRYQTGYGGKQAAK